MFFCFSAIAKQKVPVDIFVYHLKPPFIVNQAERSGLYFDFATYLNTKSSNFHFRTIFVPRKRLEIMLESKSFDGILQGVSPVWFKDKAETQYLWTGNFYADQDEVVSLPEKAFEYSGPSSMIGGVLGGVRGFYYFGIDELVNKGEIVRWNTVGEFESLQMLQFKRVDFAIVSRSTLNYLSKENNWQNQFHISKVPHDTYQRRILIPFAKKNVFDDISPFVANLANDPIWQSILAQY